MFSLWDGMAWLGGQGPCLSWSGGSCALIPVPLHVCNFRTGFVRRKRLESREGLKTTDANQASSFTGEDAEVQKR